MAGKDGKLESKGGDVIRQGFMIKRSQNKKRFTPVNYKQRWFVLTKHYLIYYDGDGERRKERGRIAVESVHVVETASLGNGSTGGGGGIGDAAGGGDAGGGSGGIPSGLPFQVGYREAGQEYTLYLLATREQDRAEWIRAIRAVCSENSGLSGRYHAGLWSGKRWSCCRLSTRSAEGCDTCSSWSTKPTANTTNPSLTTTSASTTLISMSGGTVNNSIITSDHRSQSTQNAEANNNPIVQPQSRSTIGQLAVINSFSEEEILLRMMQDKKINIAWLGIHDLYEEGDWVTVTGEPLEKTGFSGWTTTIKQNVQPDNSGGAENCATLIIEGGMNDVNCNSYFLPFFCEISA